MANNEDKRPPSSDDKPVEAGAKARPDSMRPQRSQPTRPTTSKGSAPIPPASSAANRRPPRQAQVAPPQQNMTVARPAAIRRICSASAS